MSVIVGRYWDSATFLAWLNQDESTFPLCDAVIESAKAGQLRIVTSTLTFAEVFWMKRGEKLSQAQRDELVQLFGYSWIVTVELDRPTAEMARRLIWSHNVKSWDAVHVASALSARKMRAIECFDTFDGGLIKLTGLIPGSDLTFGFPNVTPRLPFSKADDLSTETAPPSGQSLAVAPLSSIAPEPARPAAPHAAQELPQPGSSPDEPPPSPSGQ